MQYGLFRCVRTCLSLKSPVTTGANILAAVWLCLFAATAPAAQERLPFEPELFTDKTCSASLAAVEESPRRQPDRTPTPASLHKGMIVGDSFAVGLAMTITQSLGPRKDVVVSGRGKVSSGLNSPRFYDWEKNLSAFLASEKPEFLVVMLGGNDAKNGNGTPQWSLDYQEKAKRLLNIAAGYDIPVYWVGLPPMREKSYSQRAWIANEAMKAACASDKNCRFITSWDLFSDGKGDFCAKKPVGGKAKSLRGKDGVHFTMTGYRLLTDRIAAGLVPPSR